LHRFHEKVGALLGFAVWALKPACRLMTHDVGNLATHVKFSDSVGVVFSAGLVSLAGLCQWSGLTWVANQQAEAGGRLNCMNRGG
jgi:hypothetical protein